MAITTAACVKPTDTPRKSSEPPSSPSRPNAASRPIPATAGGSTSGSSITVKHDGAATEPAARDEVRGRRADEEDDRLRDEARLRGYDERVEDDAAPELAQKLARRHAEEDGGDREQEERERQAEREDERDVEGRAAHHGSPNPAAVSRARPVLPSTRCTNARAAALASLEVTTQMP